ncbi:MAG: hypothetical protein RIT40_698 [Planctomycetota bacterium]
MRWLPGIDVDRAELRTTLAYQFTGAFSAGLEYNPLADDLGVIANWRFVEETETTPAWMLGTSSDRIGTPSGRSVYLTAAKSLEAWLDLPVAPYAGVAYGEYDEEFVGIGGLAIAWGSEWSSLHLYDGHNFHTVVERAFDDQTLGLVLAQQDEDWTLGLSWTLSFASPWANE